MRLLLIYVLSTLCVIGGRGTPLDDYVNKPDSTYNYEILETRRASHCTVYQLNMTSQTWKPTVQSRPIWWHDMIIIIPDKIEMDSALMLIDGGSNDKSSGILNFTDRFTDLMTWIANSTHSVTAILKHVPNQPIAFKDDPSREERTEDAIIAWTWKTFIEGNGTDPDILLQLPMTKAAVRGLDTVQDLASKVANHSVKRFCVTGASKRGWATWTTTAVDKRVVAFAPIVMDLLNLVKNLHHYYRSLGGWTFAFVSYYLTDFTSMIDRPSTQKMADIVDPISYTERYRDKPKLIMSAGGDEFFMIDDSRFYYDQLLGPSYLRMVPNTDHTLSNKNKSVFQELQAFYLSVMYSHPLPILSWKKEYTSCGGRIILKSNIKPQSVQIYHAATLSSKRKDFRMYVLSPTFPYYPVFNPVKWFRKNATRLSDNTFVAEFENPREGWRAFFIEVTFPGLKNSTLTFTTETVIIPDTYPFSDCHGVSCRGHLV